MPRLVKRRMIPNSAGLIPVCQVPHLNGQCDFFGESQRPSPEWATSDDKTIRFVVIDPSSFRLEGNLYNNDFSRERPRHPRLTLLTSSVIINACPSPDESAPAMPDFGALRAVILATNRSGVRREAYTRSVKMCPEEMTANFGLRSQAPASNALLGAYFLLHQTRHCSTAYARSAGLASASGP
jgi:hypothetical protein